mgnify:CR=1 FL=1
MPQKENYSDLYDGGKDNFDKEEYDDYEEDYEERANKDILSEP